MKKITLNLLAFFVTVLLWQVNAQTFDGGSGNISDNQCPINNAFDATSTAVGNIGTAVGDFQIAKLDLDISHTWDGDLQIRLESPSGQILDLSVENGGSGDNYTETVFQDGGDDITFASAPFTGTYQPEEGTFASTFAGEDANGVWALQVCDGASGDSGAVNSFFPIKTNGWSLTAISISIISVIEV